MSKKFLITAGPTREQIDPVRYLSNYSTGFFGYMIAEEARNSGYEVCLVTGPVELFPPDGVEVIRVETAEEMKNEVLFRADESDCLIMAAAVADFKPKQKSVQKIKKKENWIIELEKTSDILQELSQKSDIIKIGFALETEDPVENGRKKLETKNLDMIIVNTKTPDNDPFGDGKKKYIIISREGIVETFEKIEKITMAKKIVEKAGILIL